MNEGSGNNYVKLERLISTLQELLEEAPAHQFPMVGYLLELARMEASDALARINPGGSPPQ